jgi:hypothetical protein
LKLVQNHMLIKKKKFFGQILHPQWPAQTSKIGQKIDFVLEGLIVVGFVVIVCFVGVFGVFGFICLDLVCIVCVFVFFSGCECI